MSNVIEFLVSPPSSTAVPKTIGWDGPGWYYWNGFKTFCFGPYNSEKEAQQALEKHIEENYFKKKHDSVNHPSHYTQGKIEVIEAVEDWKCGFHDGNIIKYVARYRFKNGLEDLKKAKWYLERLISKLEKEKEQEPCDRK